MFKHSFFSASKRAALLLMLSALLAGNSSVSFAGLLPAQITPEVGSSYYTRYNFWVEKEKSPTTNYSRGELIPFNTKVTLEAVSKKKIVLNADGRKITLVNIRKHTQRDSAEIASELLSPKKISLSGISKSRQADMESGVLRLGMSKDQTIMTRGYPPRHKTPSIKANHWVYWTSRFVQRTVVFEQGKLARGRGLY